MDLLEIAESGDDSGSIIQYVMEELNKFSPEEISNILKKICISKLSLVIIITFIRCTFSSREKISYWNTFVINAAKEIYNRDKNPLSLLKGCYDINKDYPENAILYKLKWGHK